MECSKISVFFFSFLTICDINNIDASRYTKRWLGAYLFLDLKYLTNCCILQQNTDSRINATTVGQVLLKTRGFFTEDYWFWVCVAALFGFSILFNILFVGALTYLNRKLH